MGLAFNHDEFPALDAPASSGTPVYNAHINDHCVGKPNIFFHHLVLEDLAVSLDCVGMTVDIQWPTLKMTPLKCWESALTGYR